MKLSINNISLNKILLSAIIFSFLVTSAIESYNFYNGFNNFSIEREVRILITNFVIGIFGSYFHYKKKRLNKQINNK